MQYILIDKNPDMIRAWSGHFSDYDNVKILEGDLTTQVCDAIVSPANSFGFMDGGVDYAISERLGWGLQYVLQKKIKSLPEGELLVGKALVISTQDSKIPFLIAAPTMRVPMSFTIASSMNAYLAMKAALIEAKRHPQIDRVAMPGFCTGIGTMIPTIAAAQMHLAFREIELELKNDFATFSDAQKYQRHLNPRGKIWE